MKTPSIPKDPRKEPVRSADTTKVKKRTGKEPSRLPTPDWRTVFSAIGSSAVILAADHTILAVNAATCHSTGKTETELRGKKCWKVFHGQDAPCPPRGCPMEQTLASGKDANGEMDVEAIGSMCRVSCTPIFDGNGVISSIIHIVTEGNGRFPGEPADISRENPAVNALLRSDEQYRLIAENTADNIWIFDMDFRLKYISPSVEKMRGFTVNEALAMPLDQQLTPVSLARVMKRFNAEMELEAAGTADPHRTISFESEEYCKDGSTIWVENSVTLLRDADNRPTGILGISRDITKRRRAEEALKLHSEILQNMAEGVVLTGISDGNIVYTNPRFDTMFGYDPGELAGRHISILNAPDEKNPEMVADEIIDSLKQTGAWRGEVHNVRKDGTAFWSNAAVSTFDHPDYGLVWVSVHLDITGRKRAEESLRESEERYRSLFTSIDEGFCIVEMIFDTHKKPVDYRFLEINPSFEKQTGLRGAKGRTMRELAPDHEEYWFEIFGNIALTGQPVRFVQYASQLLRWYDVYAFRFGPPEHRQVSILFNDISDRKQTEAALQKSEEKFRNVFDWANDAILLHTPTIEGVPGRFIEANLVACRMLGYSRKELLLRGPLHITPPEFHQQVADIIRRSRHTDTFVFEIMLLRKDGTTFPAESSAHIVQSDEKKIWISHIRDITERKQAEEALRKSEERFRLLLQSVPSVAVQGYRHDGTVQYWNEASERLYGFTSEEALGKNLVDLIIPPEMSREVRQAITHMAETGRPIPASDLSLMRKDGSRVPVFSSHAVIQKSNGETELFCIDIDLTDRRRAEKALRESEEFNRNLVENIPDYLLIYDQRGTILYHNPVFPMTFGYAPEEAIGSHIIEHVVPEDREKVRFLMAERFTDANIPPYEVSILKKDGSAVPVIVKGKHIQFHDHDAVLVLMNDISVHKRSEMALRESEKRYRLLADNSTDVIWTLDLNGAFTYISPSVFSLRGYTPEEIMHQPMDEVICSGSLAVVQETMHQSLEKAKSGIIPPAGVTEVEQPCRDGSTVWTEVVSRLVFDETGKPAGFIGVSRNITDRKREETELARVNRALRMYSASNRALVHITEEATLTHEICRIAVEMGGYRMACIGFAEDDAAKTVHTVAFAGFESGFLKSARITWADSERGRGPTGTAIRTGHPSIARDIVRDPAFAPWREDAVLRGYRSAIALPLTSNRRTFGALCIYAKEVNAFDTGEVEILTELADDLAFGLITLRTRSRHEKAEKTIRNLNAYNRSLIEASIDPLVTINADGRILDVNTATETVTGSSRSELTGSDFSGYFTDPQKAKDGYLRAFSEGKVLDYPLEIRHRDGHITPVLYNATVYRDHDGEIKGVFAAARDISERKQAENLQENLMSELARKNAELDRFTYTVSHDLKSPLMSIRGYVSLLEDDIKSGKSARVKTYITHISESAEKLELLITTLLTLSRSGRTVNAPVPVLFTDLAREAAGLLEVTLQDRGVTLVIPDGLPVVSGDRQRLLQVMVNLIDNAVKFMGDQKKPAIEVGVRTDAGTQVFFVRDNGSGIRNENLSKVFTLFERFNPDVPGTGIGLATVRRIIEAHGGKIWVESEGEMKGTTICFTLAG